MSGSNPRDPDDGWEVGSIIQAGAVGVSRLNVGSAYRSDTGEWFVLLRFGDIVIPLDVDDARTFAAAIAECADVAGHQSFGRADVDGVPS